MLSDGGCIKDVQVRLLLSSRNEMQKVIDAARQQTLYNVYMQQNSMQQNSMQQNSMQQNSMQQPQIAIVGALPLLTAKVYDNSLYLHANKVNGDDAILLYFFRNQL